MMRRPVVVKKGFERAYVRLSPLNKQFVDEALKSFSHYLVTRRAPVGLGITHLGSQTYEFRAGLDLRIVYLAHEDQITLALLGSHDEVRRFLKNQ